MVEINERQNIQQMVFVLDMLEGSGAKKKEEKQEKKQTTLMTMTKPVAMMFVLTSILTIPNVSVVPFRRPFCVLQPLTMIAMTAMILATIEKVSCFHLSLPCVKTQRKENCHGTLTLTLTSMMMMLTTKHCTLALALALHASWHCQARFEASRSREDARPHGCCTRGFQASFCICKDVVVGRTSLLLRMMVPGLVSVSMSLLAVLSLLLMIAITSTKYDKWR